MKNILIIGGSSGIGEQLVQQLSATHRVWATYNATPPPEQKIETVSYHSVNVLDENSDFSFLPNELHGVAYCPGSIQLKPFARIKPEDFIADYQLQVVGAIKIIQAVLPKLKAAENASIVLFSTVAVKLGLNFHTQVAASKGAIEGLAKALAAEFAPKIRVNCIAPSLTDTPMAAALLNTPEKREANAQRNPLKKIGEAKDIANMAAFLLSEQASWITAQTFAVDGGMSVIKN